MPLLAWPAFLWMVVVGAGTPAGSADRLAALRLRRSPVVEVFERTKDAVVSIACTRVVERPVRLADPFEPFFHLPFDAPYPKREVQTVGSGFVLDSRGYVVTNAHVVRQTIDQKVIFKGDRRLDARPVAVLDKADLAILKVDADEPLPELPLGRSDDLMIGETVLAIGNPFGYDHTLTTGVISALDRRLDFPNGVTYTGLIQTDASINPGNSGGPLLNILGELIGINTAIRGDAQNIGFAIPVNELRKAVPDMLSLEHLKRVKVGLRVESRSGIVVVEVEPDSPAHAAQIKPGDQVVSMNGRRLKHDVDFYISLLDKRAGDTVTLVVERAGRSLTAALTLRAKPVPDGARLAQAKLGMRIQTLPAELREQLELEGGLLVVEVDPGGPADRAGIERGMIIVTIAGDYPRDLDHVGLLLENVRKGQDVTVGVWEIRGRMIHMYPLVTLKAR